MSVTLAICPPTATSIYPACPIHQLFGIECPGCGSTRAFAALLHGRLQEALHLNALLVLLLPVALTFAMTIYRRALHPGNFRWPTLPTPAIYAAITVTALFTIMRNVTLLIPIR